MKTELVAFALAALAFTGLALAEKPRVKPYAAGAPYGGIPLWKPGEKFIGVSGGSVHAAPAPSTSSIYSTMGAWCSTAARTRARSASGTRQVEPEVYAELLTMLVKTKVLDEEIKRRTCLKGRSMLIVMRSASDAGDVQHGVAEFRLRRACRSRQADRRVVHRFHWRRRLARAPKVMGTLPI